MKRGQAWWCIPLISGGREASGFLLSSKARMVYMASSRMARNAERSSVSNNQKNVERKPRRRSKVRDPGTKDGVSKSLFIWQRFLSMPLLPALKAVLMLCKTVEWRFASNTEEVSEAHAVHRNSKNQGGCARREGQINPH